MKRLLAILLALLIGGSLYAQQITNASYHTVAHISKDGTIQDASYHTVGHIRSDGTVMDASYRTIGHIREDGTVMDASYHTIGHAKGIPLAWAALYFFFSN